MNTNSNILNLFPKQQGTQYPVVKTNVINDTTTLEVPIVINDSNGVYTWLYIKMNRQNYHYRGLVDAIISLKYDQSEAFAIILNYLDDKEKYNDEFNEFQEWRKFAKNFARNHFKKQ